MRILSVETKNFRLLADVDVSVPAGVVGVIGQNESGKSSVVEAAVWALYGGDTTRGTKSGLRWHRAPARHIASVTLRFELAGDVYRIERDENNARLIDEGTDQVLAEGTAAVNAYTPGLVGMGHAEFASSYLVRQKDVARIASMQPTERQAFIRSVMGVGKIDRALKACRARKNALAEERRGLEAGLGERAPLDEAVETATAALAHAREAREVRERELRAAADAHGAATEALEASTGRKRRHEELERIEENARNALEVAGLEISKLERRIQQQAEARRRLQEAEPELQRAPDLRARRDALAAAKAAARERDSLLERLARLQEELDGPDGLKDRIRDAERQVQLVDPDEHATANRLAGELDEKLAKLRDERLAARARKLAAAEAAEKEADRHARRLAAIREAGEAGECPTCIRRLGEQFAAVVETLEEEERKALATAEDCRSAAEGELSQPRDEEIELEIARDAAEEELERLEQLRKDARLAQSRLQDLLPREANAQEDLENVRARLSELPETPFSQDELAEVEGELRRLQELAESLTGDRGLIAQAETTAAELDERQEMQAAAEAELESAREELEALAFDPRAHSQLVDVAERARKAVEDARVALARAEEAERAAAVQRREALNTLEAYDQRAVRLREVLEDHRTHERAAARLADFRVAVAATIRPEMEELMSGFIHLLTDGRHEAVTLSEDFEAVLHESGVPTEVVSGGTEDIAALAMRLAISQMIAERAGHPLSLLILDEPFGSLDETRRGNVLSLIRRLRGVFRQVIVISHVAETRDAVDHVIELEFDEAEGRARVVSAPALEAVA